MKKNQLRFNDAIKKLGDFIQKFGNIPVNDPSRIVIRDALDVALNISKSIKSEGVRDDNLSELLQQLDLISMIMNETRGGSKGKTRKKVRKRKIEEKIELFSQILTKKQNVDCNVVVLL